MLSSLLRDGKFLSLAAIVVSAMIYIVLERFFPADRQRLFRKGWATDFFLYTLLQSYVMGLVIAGVIAWLDGTTGLSRFHLVTEWPLALQVAFFLVVHDLYIYWFHRLQHWSPVLWRLHEAHHSVGDVDWLAGSRSHCLEILINQTIEFAPIVLLGGRPEVALIKGTMDAVWGMYIHSNIRVRSGWLQYVINGPEMHRWHHSREYRGYGMNFATKIAVWDWLFGTAYLPKDKDPPGYGLDNPEYPEGYFGQHVYSFRRFRPQRTSSDAPEAAE
jgi:sterol desaturase/sphingolipid hydroxylase (fatty acid hydroxylase superfamily)